MFSGCSSLTRITISASVTNLGDGAFWHCTGLSNVFFFGNAPTLGSGTVFTSDPATVYYLPGTTGWYTPFGGLTAVCWNPQARNLGVQTNQFRFTITGSSNLTIVVEACTNLVNAVWSPVGTNTLTGGSSPFSDPQWTNYPSRFYRFRAP